MSVKYDAYSITGGVFQGIIFALPLGLIKYKRSRESVKLAPMPLCSIRCIAHYFFKLFYIVAVSEHICTQTSHGECVIAHDVITAVIWLQA